MESVRRFAIGAPTWGVPNPPANEGVDEPTAPSLAPSSAQLVLVRSALSADSFCFTFATATPPAMATAPAYAATPATPAPRPGPADPAVTTVTSAASHSAGPLAAVLITSPTSFVHPA